MILWSIKDPKTGDQLQLVKEPRRDSGSLYFQVTDTHGQVKETIDTRAEKLGDLAASILVNT